MPTLQELIKQRQAELAGKEIGPAIKGGRPAIYTGPDIVYPNRTESFPGGFGPGDIPLTELPNYEKLTRSERWVQQRLPGIADTDLGRWLAKLDEGWMGKVLQVIDVGAEGLERVTGFGAQAL